MAGDKGRLDLRVDLRRALAPYTDEEPAVTAVLTAVLPHLELAYQRGVMGERSKAGYQTRRKPREE